MYNPAPLYALHFASLTKKHPARAKTNKKTNEVWYVIHHPRMPNVAPGLPNIKSKKQQWRLSLKKHVEGKWGRKQPSACSQGVPEENKKTPF